MSILSKTISHLTSGFSTDHYYKSMNEALKRLNKEYTMLHYPYHLEENDSFLEAQKNLTDFCISKLSPINGKKILEIGCGNGVQAKYILDKYTPESMVGIDLNPTNIEIAKSEAKRLEICNITFHIDDAQQLSTIESESMDYIINIESAFHYPDKASFLREVFRVLKPGGTFLIADILTLHGRKMPFRKMWKKKMNLHHWPLETYNKELIKAKLHVVSFSDITNKVIHGFQNYRYWLKSLKKKNFIEDLFIKIYYSIHVELNMHLLRSRRQYCVFVGKRPFGT
ncbi:MAG: class I SAM-dependent methyltransferase [Bacteroidales bacterium]|nr:class I SAM-dependent methyltransferase [Bacteroidales bacterium]